MRRSVWKRMVAGVLDLDCTEWTRSLLDFWRGHVHRAWRKQSQAFPAGQLHEKLTFGMFSLPRHLQGVRLALMAYR